MRQLRGTELKRFKKQLLRPPVELAVVLQDVEDPVNVGSAFRIADAAGVDRLILTGITACPPNKILERVARGKERRVRWTYEKEIEAALVPLKRLGFLVCAVELTDDAVPYDSQTFAQKTCLVVGHEDHGVTKHALSLCDTAVFIPMFGKGASLNVHVALGILCFEVLRRAKAPAEPGTG